MPHRTKPREGSLQFWPRKKARRIYPRISHWNETAEGICGFAGWKAGMTHIEYTDNNPKSRTYGKGIIKPVTIIDAPPLFICGYRLYEKKTAGLRVIAEKWTQKIPKNIEVHRKTHKGPSKDISAKINKTENIRLIVSTQPEKSGLRKKKPEIFEIAIGGTDINKKYEFAEKMLGKEIYASDVFRPGEFTIATAVTKGHGFTGPVKRFGIKIQGRKNEQHHRHVGSVGSVVPRKVDWRVPLPGQYGFFTRTEINKRVIAIDDNSKKIKPKGGFTGYGTPKFFMLIEGSLPGHKKRLVILRKSRKKSKPVDIKYISTESRQGR